MKVKIAGIEKIYAKSYEDGNIIYLLKTKNESDIAFAYFKKANQIMIYSDTISIMLNPNVLRFAKSVIFRDVEIEFADERTKDAFIEFVRDVKRRC